MSSYDTRLTSAVEGEPVDRGVQVVVGGQRVDDAEQQQAITGAASYHHTLSVAETNTLLAVSCFGNLSDYATHRAWGRSRVTCSRSAH
ncbi:hypothetical protein [Actinoplanes siamensis]|uniref:hypothetical protein n=1 Tax=Actinoplanes siamensis TaxID=1223317 RepID=UPI00366C74D9